MFFPLIVYNTALSLPGVCIVAPRDFLDPFPKLAAVQIEQDHPQEAV